jgi:hypothetical protein
MKANINSFLMLQKSENSIFNFYQKSSFDKTKYPKGMQTVINYKGMQGTVFDIVDKLGNQMPKTANNYQEWKKVYELASEIQKLEIEYQGWSYNDEAVQQASVMMGKARVNEGISS